MKKYLYILLIGLLSACGTSKDQEETNGSEEIVEELIPSIVSQEVNYSADTTTMNGYLAFDEHATEKRPGILVIHEWWGHNEYVRNRADMLAELGYVAMALDMYGNGRQAEHPDEAGKFAGMVMSNMDAAKARFDAALETLKSNSKVDTSKIAAIGYCFGGSVALTMANAGYDLDAVAAFHSGIELPVMPGEELKARILVCNGADDPMVTPRQVEQFTKSLEEAGADYKYVSYDTTVHAYTNPGATALGERYGLPLRYNEEADKESWNELQEFLSTTFN